MNSLHFVAVRNLPNYAILQRNVSVVPDIPTRLQDEARHVWLR
jgi:hypothetical protein